VCRLGLSGGQNRASQNWERMSRAGMALPRKPQLADSRLQVMAVELFALGVNEALYYRPSSERKLLLMGRGRALQPALAALVALQVLERAPFFAAAEIRRLDVFVVHELIARAVQHYLAVFHDVAVAGEAQRPASILFHQQHGQALFAIDGF